MKESLEMMKKRERGSLFRFFFYRVISVSLPEFNRLTQVIIFVLFLFDFIFNLILQYWID